MASPDEIAALITQGWSPVPVKAGEKRPSDAGWQSRTFSASDFSASDNIGNKNGAPSQRVDVDCDAPQAVKIAGLLLPLTRVHGRASKPRSHYWYACDAPTTTFKDVNGEMLIELRGTGSQTVIPPSVHTSGEAIVWEDDRPLLAMDPDTLMAAVTQVAAAALVARHWPTGSRHAAAGHLGGYLARAGWDSPTIERVIRATARTAGDDEVEDRARFARETADKHYKGGQTTGGTSLKEMFGEGVLALLNRWLKRETEDRIDEMNERHFVVQIGRNMAVGTEPRRPHLPLIFQNYTDFEQKYCNQFVEKKKLGRWWLEHPRRRTYESLVFAPPGARFPAEADDYNLWRGFAVEPDPRPRPETRCARYLDHLFGVIASEHDGHYAYVLDLLADAVQRPGDPPGKALVLRGGQGVGKSLAIETFGHLFGRHFMALSNRDQLTGNFNAHLSGKVVVFADEAIWGGQRNDLGTLKHLVTQRVIPVTRKGIDTVSEPNFMHLFMATNEGWAWPAGNKERRGVVLDVDSRRPQTYFDTLVAEIQAPGFGASLLAYLLARQIDYTRLRGGLDTKALREQQAQSADPVQQWWLMVLEEGQIGGDWPPFVSTKALYEAFTDEMGSLRGAGYTHRGTRMVMMTKLMAMLPAHATIEPRRVRENLMPKGAPPVWSDERSTRCVILPRLDACRKAYDRFTGSTHEWPEIEPVPSAGMFEGDEV